MLALLQSHSLFIIGALLVLLVVTVRTVTADAILKRDLRGAVFLLTAYLVIRVLDWSLPESSPAGLQKLVRVGWMLAFAWGCCRGLVSLVLKVVRLRRNAVTPKIVRDVIDFTLYAVSSLSILKSQLNIDLTSLIATSAILSVVIGLALQDTLGNLFAGLSLQLERPYEVGDWVTIAEHTGKVSQIGWRATRMDTFRRESVTLPNNMVAKSAVRNYSRGGEPVGVDLRVGLTYDAPPNQVQRAIRDILDELPGVLKSPPPLVRAWNFGESSLEYHIRYFVSDYIFMDSVKGEFFTLLWYRLKREGIHFAFPQRTLTFRENTQEFSGPSQRELLDSIDLFRPLTPDERDQVQRESHVRRFGRNEKVIEEGEEGHTFYVVMEGEVSVRSLGKEVTRVRRGGYFGEMSLLTGEPRAATVVALDDVVLLELDRPTFRRLFSSHPGLAKQLSSILAERRSELRAIAANAPTEVQTPEEHDIFSRLRNMFGLRD